MAHVDVKNLLAFSHPIDDIGIRVVDPTNYLCRFYSYHLGAANLQLDELRRSRCDPAKRIWIWFVGKSDGHLLPPILPLVEARCQVSYGQSPQPRLGSVFSFTTCPSYAASSHTVCASWSRVSFGFDVRTYLSL